MDPNTVVQQEQYWDLMVLCAWLDALIYGEAL
jgi:hypothetical protein